MEVPAKRCPHCGLEAAAGSLFCPRDGKPLQPGTARVEDGDDPHIGVELDGQIVIKELIGIGTMGRVYRAFQGGVERDVAVKILRAELTVDEEAVARFHREAKIASRLVHPNVVAVLMSGRLEPAYPGGAGSLFLVMEHLAGISLLSALEAAGPAGGRALPLPRALAIMQQVCEAVAEAHAHGIIHRDIKPENVMLVERGGTRDYVKVLDFGVARLLDSRSTMTEAGLVFGSASYISPEGAMGEPVGPAADVYSIATVLYECLAGRPPFVSDSPVKLLLDHVQEEPPDIRGIERAAYVPAALAQAIMQNLSKEPADRAPHAGALARALRDACRRDGIDINGGSTGPAELRLVAQVPTRDMAHAFTPTRRTEAESAPEREPNTGRRTDPVSQPEPGSQPEPEPEPESEREPDEGRTAGPEPEEQRPRRGGSTSYPALIVALLAALLLLAGWRWREQRQGQVLAAMEAIRGCANQGQWVAPPEQNVKALLADTERRWPADRRVVALRGEMGQRLLAEALRLKYADRRMEAAQLVRLAIELSPELEAAPRLLIELRREPP